MAWIIGGDFNEVLSSCDKQGGNPCDFLAMKAFRDLRDISQKGYQFTWRNGRQEGYIEEMLDRAVANSVWHDIFRNATVETII